MQRILAQVKWDIRLDFFYICHIVTLSNEVGVILWERKGILMEEFNSEVYLFWIFHLPNRRLKWTATVVVKICYIHLTDVKVLLSLTIAIEVFCTVLDNIFQS